MKKIALTALIILAACVDTVQVTATPAQVGANNIALAKNATIHNYKDPSSAQFRLIKGYRLANKDIAVCGEVNAKNSYGAYVGYKQFYVRLRNKVVVRQHLEFGASLACNQAVKGAIALPA